MTTAVKRLKYKTMAETAAEEIRKRIFGGIYEPGMHLRQDALAAEFGMSRIPVREALLLLESEGILTILPHRGAIVVELSPDEIEELFNMRLLLEPFLFLRSAPHLTEDDFRSLEKNLHRYAAAIDEVNIALWNDLNTEFHLLLYKYAQSPRMVAMIQNLLAECDRHTRIQLTNILEDRHRAVEEHELFLKLCKEKRYEEGAEFMKQHINHMRIVLLDLLRQHRQAVECEHNIDALPLAG